MGDEIHTAHLPDAGFLAEASERLKSMLSAQASCVTLKAGEMLFEQGDPGDALFAISSGELEFSILSLNGRKLTLDLMGPGDIFGEIALFDPGPRTATATATLPSQVLRVRSADVQAQLSQHPELAIDMIRLAGRRMRYMGQQLNEQVFLAVPSRLARKLLHLINRCEDGGGTVNLSQTELAEFVGATREAVSKAISTWKRQGVLEPTRGGLRIHDLTALEELADPDQF